MRKLRKFTKLKRELDVLDRTTRSRDLSLVINIGTLGRNTDAYLSLKWRTLNI